MFETGLKLLHEALHVLIMDTNVLVSKAALLYAGQIILSVSQHFGLVVLQMILI